MATTSLPHHSFLVYILRRSDKVDPYDEAQPAPFYVGKGKPNRPYFHFWEARKTTRNMRRFNIIRAVEAKGGMITVDIVASEVSEPVAFTIERQLIYFYGREDQGGLLANHTDGGEGPAGMALEARQRIGNAKRGIPRSPETIEKMRQSQTGFRHSEATKKKLALLSLGKKHSPEARAKMSIAIQAAIARGRKPVDWTPERRAHFSAMATGRKYPAMAAANRGAGNPAARGLWVDDQFYGTVKEAAEALGVNKTTIYHRLQRNDPRYRYEAGTEALGEKLGGENSIWARAVIVDGVRYATVDEAILQLGIGKTTWYRRVRKGVYKVEYETAPPARETTARPVKVNGIEYPSVNDAMKALQVPDTTFYRRVKSGFYVVEPLEP